MTNAEPNVSAAVTSKDVAKGAGTTLVARLGAVIEVIAQPLYVAMLGLASYGLYAVLWAAINLVENVADLVMTSSMQRVVPQARTKQAEVAALRSAMILGVGPCILVAIVVSAGAASFAPLFNASEADSAHLVSLIALFAWALPLWAFIEIATSALRSKRVFGAEIRLRIFWEQLIRLVLAALLWFIGFSTLSIFYAHLASLAIVCVLCVRLVSRHFELRYLFAGKIIDPVFSETLKAGLAVLPANTLARLFADGPSLVLNWMLPGSSGAVAGGLYAIARKISTIVQVVRTAFAYVLAPLASAASQNHRDEVRSIFGFATRVSAAIAVPAGVVLASAGKPILSLFGSGAEVALPAVVIMLLARVAETIFGTAVPIQQVTSSYWRQLLASLAGLGTAVAIGAILVPEDGLTGMAIAVSAGFVVAAGLPMAQLFLHDRLHPFSPPFLTVLFRALFFAGLGLIASVASQQSPVWSQIPLALAVLLASMWLSCRFALPHGDRVSMGKTGRALRLS